MKVTKVYAILMTNEDTAIIVDGAMPTKAGDKIIFGESEESVAVGIIKSFPGSGRVVFLEDDTEVDMENIIGKVIKEVPSYHIDGLLAD